MNEAMHVCPLCESGELTEITYSDVLELRGAEYQVDGLVISICSHCNEESLSLAQMKANNKTVAAYRASLVDAERAQQGLMRGEEIRRVREHLGLTQQQAARVFGGGANAFSKYERGEVIQSEIMDRLLRVSEQVPAALDWLIEASGVRGELLARDVVDDDVPRGSWYTVVTPHLVQVQMVDKRHQGPSVRPVLEEAYGSDEWMDVPKVAGWR